MASTFFIDRPVLVWVIILFMGLAGFIALYNMPIEQYPVVAPPTITIEASYPGANAKAVENGVTQIIEQSLTGIDHLRYFNSASADNGMTITLSFDPKADPDVAQVQTQNRIQTAFNQLPPEVLAQGVTVNKANLNFLLIAAFYNPEGKFSEQTLSDIVASKLREPIARVNGVGDVEVFGEPHAMRIWLDPLKLRSYDLTPIDVKKALQAQNIDVSSGQIGGMPLAPKQQLNAVINVQSLYKTPKEFEDILLKVKSNGSTVKIKDVARVQIGAKTYDRIVRYKRLPAAGIGVSLASGANALDTTKRVKKTIEQQIQAISNEIEVFYPYDTTPFIKKSINNVLQAFSEALCLILIVLFVFLQNLRATFIAFITIPIVVLGTFSILFFLGFSINILTLFALILAIGLLIDDAIIVIENVDRVMMEKNFSPRKSVILSMSEITAALIGIALVLSAVFVPMIFFPGTSGEIYKQFSVTIIVSMILSVLVALFVSPSLCASILKLSKRKKPYVFFILSDVNRFFEKIKQLYLSTANTMLKHSGMFVIVLIGLFVCLGLLYVKLPKSFIPNEDQGIVYFLVSAPNNSSIDATLDSVKIVEDYILSEEKESLKDLFSITGFSFAGIAQNTAIGFIGLKDLTERNLNRDSVFAFSERVSKALANLPNAYFFAFFPPPIPELGNSFGFDLQLVDSAGLGREQLLKARDTLLQLAATDSRLINVRHNSLDDQPQYKLNIDKAKALSMGLKIEDIHETLQIAFGSLFVNFYNDQGKIKQVTLQADAPFRMQANDINNWYVRNVQDEMVSFQAFTSGEWLTGPVKLERFNGLPSINIVGEAKPGASSAQAMAAIQSVVNEHLPKGIRLEWIGLSFEEQQNITGAHVLYLISIFVVFLGLAALYESWTIPFTVLLTLPLGVLGATLSAALFSLENDIYFQVAVLTTIGLCAKNAILIVEFANNLLKQNHSKTESALMALKLRFRPIIMTSLVFIMGVLPLALAQGASANSQNAIGISVVGGMLAATILVPLFVPLIFCLVCRKNKAVVKQ
tara:strand:+ start:2908 stop:6018 length:3111 start_codon:yes stop_codon:yes gene_type:complete